LDRAADGARDGEVVGDVRLRCLAQV
jgi:hypothetical protein